MSRVSKVKKYGIWGYQFGKQGTFHPITNSPGSEQRAKERAIKDQKDHEQIRRDRSNILFNILGI